MRRRFALAAVLALPLALAGCGSFAPDPDAGRSQPFEVERYFTGRVKAWGLIEPRFGGTVRQFTVEMQGRRDGDALVLDEQFVYSDGERQQRQWRIRKLADGSFEGEAADAVGKATGREDGSSFRMLYALNVTAKGSTWQLDLDDRLFRIDEEMVLNRIRLSKWGIAVSDVIIAFRKLD
jgi:hypothetical protein